MWSFKSCHIFIVERLHVVFVDFIFFENDFVWPADVGKCPDIDIADGIKVYLNSSIIIVAREDAC